VAGWSIIFDVAIAHGWLELATGKTIEKNDVVNKLGW